jgi:hypothetical protein
MLIIPLQQLTNHDVQQADTINAVDLNQPGYNREVWSAKQPEPARALNVVHVQIDSSQPEGWWELARRVDAVKGVPEGAT